jgi:hypothetical protein
VMVSQAPSSHPGPRARREPLFDVHPQTGAVFEVFYSDRTLETFGKCGAGWFWWSRRRGFSPDGPATGPFAASYAAYRHAINCRARIVAELEAGAPLGLNLVDNFGMNSPRNSAHEQRPSVNME